MQASTCKRYFFLNSSGYLHPSDWLNKKEKLNLINVQVHHCAQMAILPFFCTRGIQTVHGVMPGHVCHRACKHITTESHGIWWVRESSWRESLSDDGFYLHIHTRRHADTHSLGGHLHTAYRYTLFTVLHPWAVTQHRPQVESQCASKTTCCISYFFFSVSKPRYKLDMRFPKMFSIEVN